MADTKASDETAAGALDPATDGVAIVQGGSDRFAIFQRFLDMVLTYLVDDDPALTPDSDDLPPSKSAVKEYVDRKFSPVVVISGTSHNITNAEAGSYLRFENGSPSTCTFRDDATHALDDNVDYEIRCAGGDLTLTPGTTDVVLNEPFGGTLVLSDGMSVLVKRVSVDVFDVIGHTVAA